MGIQEGEMKVIYNCYMGKGWLLTDGIMTGTLGSFVYPPQSNKRRQLGVRAGR
jgi:hypothetical protein